MSINLKNIEPFTGDKNLNLKQIAKSGIIITIAVAEIATCSAMLSGCEYQDAGSTVWVGESIEAMNVSLEQVNDLNVIINNSNCSDSFVGDIIDELNDNGIKYTLTAREKDIDVNGAVVITLDQQYISGPGMVVLAPYENNRRGESDALALAMQTGFDERGFFVDEVQCGKMGYQQLDDGTVVKQIPSETEYAINPQNETSFVTLCFGTNNTSGKLVGKSIVLSLGRYVNYLSNENTNTDLIYRSEIGDTLDSVSEITGTDSSTFAVDGVLLDDTTVVSSSTKKLKSFDKKVPVDVDGKESTIWYKR